MVFDKQKREYYYKTDKKPKKDISNLSEEQIYQKLGIHFVIDFLQVAEDICQFYDIEFPVQMPLDKNL